MDRLQRRFLACLTAFAVLAAVAQAMSGATELVLFLTPLFLIAALLLCGRYIAEHRIRDPRRARHALRARMGMRRPRMGAGRGARRARAPGARAAVRLGRRHRSGAPALRPAGALAGPLSALAALPALGGHASVQSPVALLLPANVTHVLAMAAWLGGVAVLVLAVRAATARLDGDEHTDCWRA